MAAYETYTRFYTEDDAGVLISLLDKNAVPYQLEQEINQLDHIYLGETAEPMYVLKIPKDQFGKVFDLLAAQAKIDFDSPGFSHYLSAYSEEELYEIVKNPNDWNGYDVQVAALLLEQKHIANPGFKSGSQLTTDYVPEKIKTEWIAFGYCLCLSALLGIFFGLSVTQAKKTLQNGVTVNMYDDASIAHGHRMIMIGSLFSGLFLLGKFGIN